MKKTLLATLLMTASLSYAAPAPIKVKCSTPRSNVVIKINGNNLSLDGRFPAETVAQRTKINGSAITKIFFVGGEKHTIHLNDKNNFNELEDFVNIKSRKGHEMTFPLNCKKY
jgi:hypothetical protein